MSGWLFPGFLLAAGAYTAYRLRFFCFLHPIATVRLLFSRQRCADGTGFSPFRALTVALAGTLGVGNITGVAAAILLGGSGALFWMWVSAVAMMLIKYAEVYLAVITRRQEIEYGKTVFRGGPMRYLADLRGGGFMAGLFCVLCIAASVIQGNLLQTTAAVGCITDTFGVSPLYAGLIFCAAAAVLIFGGRGRIAAFCASMVPLVSMLYFVMGMTVILRNAAALPAVMIDILQNAFSLRAVGVGGTAAMLLAMRHGCAKGVFTHEAGCGTAPISHAGAETDCPEQQAALGIAEVFVDTPLMCTVTGLVLLLSGVGIQPEGVVPDAHGAVLDAFCLWFGAPAAVFLTAAVVFYAFAALVCWSFYGSECLRYLLDGCPKTAIRRAIGGYLSFYVLCAFFGITQSSSVLWQLSDGLTAAMTALNTCGVLCLLGRIGIPDFAGSRKYTKKYGKMQKNLEKSIDNGTLM